MNVLICPISDGGYLYPAIAVGIELSDRGCRTWVLAREDQAGVAALSGIPVLTAEGFGGEGSFSASRWFYEGLGQYRTILRAAAEIRADVLVTSVLCHGALLAAEVLGLPVIVLGFATHLCEYAGGADAEPPLPAARPWRANVLLDQYQRARDQAGLRRRTIAGAAALYGDALLLRGHQALEFPGAALPDRVHQVGPCAWEPPADLADVAGVRARLARSGKPVIYVHLGRVFRGLNPWPRLNAVFTGGPFQAVVEQGRSPAPEPADGADLVVVRKPWMGPLIDQAGLVLTGGTSAPVLAALARGKPLALTPDGSEQPLLAQACLRAGVGALVPAGPAQAAGALTAAWQDDGLRQRAGELGRALAQAPGARRAADLVQAIAAGRPTGNLAAQAWGNMAIS